jgi:hypothetical protein
MELLIDMINEVVLPSAYTTAKRFSSSYEKRTIPVQGIPPTDDCMVRTSLAFIFTPQLKHEGIYDALIARFKAISSSQLHHLLSTTRYL